MSTPSHLNAQPLVWGHGPRTFEVFLEPTCPYSSARLISSTTCLMRSAPITSPSRYACSRSRGICSPG